MTTFVLALVCAQAAPATPQANQADAVVTLRRKAFTWSFLRVPASRTKLPDGREVDVPSQLFTAWTPLDPNASIRFNSLFQETPERLIVNFFQPGKRYADEQDLAILASQTQSELADLAHAMLERFFEFDLDFPGGTWEDLGRIIKERLAAAYAQQLPEPVKALLPARIELDVLVRAEYLVRYPACQAKAVTLAQLHALGLSTRVAVRQESIPRVVRGKEGNVAVEVDTNPLLGQWTLSDSHQEHAETMEVAFFNLGERPGLPRAEDVVALFELAWKARGKPVFAKVKFHPETKTLMLQATSEEVFEANRAYASLTGRSAPAEPARSENPFDNIQETLKKIAELIEKQAEKK
jgi:hypothetical protein